MSMTSELVKELRKYAKGFKNSSYGKEIVGIEKLLIQAADTIEELSAKVARQNMERSSQYYGGGWIPLNQLLPKEEVLFCNNIGEMMIGSLYETNVSGSGFAAKKDEKIIYECIAWQPLPPVYEPKEE